MQQITIVGLFDSRADAERAAAELARDLGMASGSVAIHATEAAVPAAAAPSLSLASLPKRDQRFYREGMRRGAVAVCALSDEAGGPGVAAVFSRCGAADLDARESEWRGQGWTAHGPGEHGYTGHDEDIGFATYGGDAVIRPIPIEHHDNSRAGLMGRFEMAAMRDEPSRHARFYAVTATG